MMNLPYPSAEDVVIKNSQSLNSNVINAAILKLVQNDLVLLPTSEYAPDVWENRWYFNQEVHGYDIGDAVFTNCIEVSNFIDRAGDAIFDYVQQTSAFGNSAKNIHGFLGPQTWSQIKDDATTAAHYYPRYANVLSGYNGEGYTSDVPDFKPGYDAELSTFPLEPIFYLGDYLQDLDVFVSLSNDNKDLPTSASNKWRKITIHNTSEFNQYINNALDQMLSSHVEDYHYGNTKSDIGNVLEVFLRNDLSNLQLEQISNKQQLPTAVGSYYNEEGFDCVKCFKLVHDTANHTYKWFREWNSGFLEHGGIAIIAPQTGTTEVYTSVALNWTYDVGSASKAAPTFSTAGGYSISLVPYATSEPASYLGTTPQLKPGSTTTASFAFRVQNGGINRCSYYCAGRKA